MTLWIVILIIGLILLVKGADIFVDGISSIARHLRVSTFIIALTVVAFGTSSPEFAISVNGILNGNDELVLANVVGSSIVNTLLVLGVASVVHPIKVKSNTIKKELPIVLLISTLLVVLFKDNLFDKNITNVLTRTDGIVLVLFFLVFLHYLFSIIRNRTVEEPLKEEEIPKYGMAKSIFNSVFGLILIIVGSEFTVDNAVLIAEYLNISEKIISMTIITIGTSLPELVMSVIAAKKQEFDFTLGNIVGTNIFNIGIVLGVPLAVCGSISPTTFSNVDMIMVLVSALLLFFFAGSEREISKKEGVAKLFVFLVYYAYLFINI